MTYKPRDLGAALGRSIPNEGRVVIYKPKNLKEKKMAFGRARTLGKPIDVVIPIDKIDDDIRLAVTDYFKDYGGIDSYGQASNPHKAYAFPSEGSWRQTVQTGRHGELLGTFKDWHRFDGNPPAWVKKGQVKEVTQRQVDNAIQLVVHDAIVGWLKVNRGVKLEAIMDNIIGVTVAIGNTVKIMINKDPWFQAFGLKVS